MGTSGPGVPRWVVDPGSGGRPQGDGCLVGRWINDGGTVIDLHDHDDGRMTGSVRFASDGASFRPHDIRGTKVDRPDGRIGIMGTVLDWPEKATVNVWFGELDPGTGILTTRLLFASGAAPAVEWETAAGGAAFRRVG